MKKYMGVVFALVSLLAFQAPAWADCIVQSGNGDTDVNLGPFSMPAGSTINITMTAAPGAGTAIYLNDGVNPSVNSVIFSTPHQVTYQFTSDVPAVNLILDWQFNGQPENTYSVTTDDCAVEVVPATTPWALITLCMGLLCMGAVVLHRRAIG